MLLLLANPELRGLALAPIEHAAELAGLGLQQVSVSGHRFTADTDIYAALDLDNARTLLSFDAGAARARIEELPWIKRASIERIVPDRIDVRVTERVPYVVWHDGERSWLTDRAGRKLQPAPGDVMPGLMRVSGEGAAEEAAALSALLLDFPQIARKLESAERVGRRRWTLRLKGGTRLELPARGEAEALARLTRLFELGLSGAERIDLRVSSRVLAEGLDAANADEAPAVSAGRG
ncbi:MAG: FtsQ-type POTRA domain-containing protein [Hyphomicrobiaceae bacterium]|nr:FtsQ-type POTRA domain-containing protein [Hyphomicrobiaceae bacterium]